MRLAVTSIQLIYFFLRISLMEYYQNLNQNLAEDLLTIFCISQIFPLSSLWESWSNVYSQTKYLLLALHCLVQQINNVDRQSFCTDLLLSFDYVVIFGGPYFQIRKCHRQLFHEKSKTTFILQLIPLAWRFSIVTSLSVITWCNS